ncbi:MAG: LacI family DNA-binding transcriptional regulator [Clostridium sp.]|nr:LacI family DNA-binding transcriptional regulator [Clostridium sp.]
MNVTIKDIAKIANVSHTTVSRALNDSPFINEKTKNKILQISKELNYVPNYNAKSLVLNRSYNIGLFFSSISKGTSPSFFHEIIDGVTNVINQKYNIVIKGVDNCTDFNCMSSKRFDGIILVSQSESDNPFMYDVINKKIPLVVLNREIGSNNIINILSAEKDGAYEATKYLIENGHKNIAIIEGTYGFKSSVNRKEGFVNALVDSNIKINSNYFKQGDYDLESGFKAMKELIKLPDIPTAVFCSNDDMAVGAMKAAQSSDLRVPEDISIIGFDDNVFDSYVTPALTTIMKQSRKVSMLGAEKLLDVLQKKQFQGDQIYIDTKLIIRDSVKNLKINK